MSAVPTITPEELIERIKIRLDARPHRSRYSHFDVAPVPTGPATHVLILGAGFSHGVVPLVNELMHETIGDYYYPDQDQWGKRPASVLRKASARFWQEFNAAALQEGLQTVDVDRRGLPKNAGAAYQNLFTYEAASVLFALSAPRRKTYLERIRDERQSRRTPDERRRGIADAGARFVKGILRYVLDPGAEHGFGSTGRSELNAAHRHLAAILEAQQSGRGWQTCAFCRTVFTTNFDTLLQNALHGVNLLYCLTDRPERGFDSSDFPDEEGAIHLVYVHGSILRHNPASTTAELDGLTDRNIAVLRDHLNSRDVIAIGHGGWRDGLMAALHGCDSTRHTLYWCDVHPEPPAHVASLLEERPATAAYVQLGMGGADDLMRALYERLVPVESRRVPTQQQ